MNTLFAKGPTQDKNIVLVFFLIFSRQVGTESVLRMVQLFDQWEGGY